MSEFYQLSDTVRGVSRIIEWEVDKKIVQLSHNTLCGKRVIAVNNKVVLQDKGCSLLIYLSKMGRFISTDIGPGFFDHGSVYHLDEPKCRVCIEDVPFLNFRYRCVSASELSTDGLMEEEEGHGGKGNGVAPGEKYAGISGEFLQEPLLAATEARVSATSK
jgi:hypothetical protein